jgi:hypothetical protein
METIFKNTVMFSESNMSIYEIKGFKDRQDYLESLADENDIDISVVYAVADMLGEIEDFDGLPITLEDYAFMF